MNEKDLDKLFDDLLDGPTPAADPKARRQAVQMAKAEFIQGNQNTARPIDDRENRFSKLIQSIGSVFMNLLDKPLNNKAFGTLAIAFVAVSIVYVMPTQRLEQQLPTAALIEPTTTSEVVVTGKEDTELESGSDEAPNLTIPRELSIDDSSFADVSSPAIEKPQQDAKPESGRIEKKRQQERDQSNQILEEETAQGARLAMKSTSELRLAKKHILARKMPPASALMSQDAAISHRPEPLPTNPRADDREEYAEYQSNPIKRVDDEPVSTFSVDVDTASYSLVRNQLQSGYLPKPQAVRAEELINYFDYQYELPRSQRRPFEPSVNVFDSPWNSSKKLVHIGIKGYDIPANKQPDSNLVFLLDVSGSMNSANKLPLVKQSIGLLLDTLKPTDTVSIVVYAGAAGTVLEPTKVSQRAKIVSALSRLNAGGSTAGSAGIRLAYQLAEQSFNKEAVNRIILATDGDFNVGQQSNEDLQTLIERKRDSGVFLSVLGFGRNNYQDDMMQTLAQNGNGVAAYIDTVSEAKKVLVDEATSSLFPIAKDVKIQVEFNPASVSDYRLVGYETRSLAREDFNNDKVDAGDIGAGHTVTAIYEITPAVAEQQSVEPLRYQSNTQNSESQIGVSEYGFVKIRYKLPTESSSKLIEASIPVEQGSHNQEAQFSIAVAGFAQLLVNSKHTGELDYNAVIEQALKNRGDDPYGYRSEFVQLVRLAEIAQP